MPYDNESPSPTKIAAPPDITTCVDTADIAYWRMHPDVVGVLSTPCPSDDGGEVYELRLWLRPAPARAADAPERPRGVRPAREPDFEIFVAGEPHPTFTERLPAVEYLEVFCEYDWREAYPDGWWAARIWVS